MTTHPLAHLRELLAKATPGPWIAHGQLATAERITVCVTTAPAADQSWPCHVCYSYGGEAESWTCEQAKANSALIAAAVNALPGLLERVERAEAALNAVLDYPGQGSAYMAGIANIVRSALAAKSDGGEG